MPHLEFMPSAPLRDLVAAYWWHEEQHTARTEAHTLLPDGFVELGFHSGDTRLELGPGRLWRLPEVYLLGLQDGPIPMVSRGHTRVLGVRLYAWGALGLLGLNDGLSGFRTEVGPALLALAPLVLEAVGRGDPAAGVAGLEAWLLGRLDQGQEQRLPALERLIHDSSGEVRIGALAAMLGVTPRQLERLFKRAGVAPKLLARLVRFQRATGALFSDPAQPLTALAFRLGFADQAHFIREFRSFAGVSPKVFAARCRRQENRSDLFNSAGGTGV